MKTIIHLLIVVVICFTAGCSAPAKQPDITEKVKRYGMVTGIKAEKIGYYKQLHAAIWPAVAQTISKCHIRNYSIYLKEIDGKSYLFSYFEYTGDDFTGDMKKMAADTATQRWWKETAPMQVPLPDAAAAGETWSNMEEVFHL
ncbi:L-rhamnose mutarotase [Chitinophaga sp. Cy-1792]|uniref:L-rhamnose mutarotase n=1 Tax=Chitinophaga sp. Cy-1792 TaxID=2608339 RepID=UPI00141F9796|nr:L-rhamnose mutarotase [Chitinophaga sp. Cy-1792]NIG54484.1 L-rhamnose mutarotase [Chitinophaga sp. Cy-1792]